MGSVILAMCFNSLNGPWHCFGPFNTESCAAKSTDLCRFKSAAGAHLNSFKNLVVSQIQLLGKRVVSHPCCSKQVSFKTLIMEQSSGINAGLSATCCTCSHCFNLLFFMFKILMLVYWHSCSPFDKRVALIGKRLSHQPDFQGYTPGTSSPSSVFLLAVRSVLWSQSRPLIRLIFLAKFLKTNLPFVFL